MAGNIRENREIRDYQKYLNHTHKVNNVEKIPFVGNHYDCFSDFSLTRTLDSRQV